MLLWRQCLSEVRSGQRIKTVLFSDKELLRGEELLSPSGGAKNISRDMYISFLKTTTHSM